MKALLDMVKRHKAGSLQGVYSVCCAHPLVIEATLQHAKTHEHCVIIEATSNQVNQFGGYTGMQPTDFVALVEGIAQRLDFPRSRIILGGDHLGPNCWQQESPQSAMEKSAVLIDQYVRAGFRKIHLDCSMSCQGDPQPLDDHTVATRAAHLCQVAEQAWQATGGEPPVYIIGTEVPVPGGAQEGLSSLTPTSVAAASNTVEVHQQAFGQAGLGHVWPRIIALVVQPGVEFDHHNVIAFDAEQAQALSQYVESHPGMLYEAHSTDYQTDKHLQQLVKHHFAILKVGPWLTFALREACWALDAIEQTWLTPADSANLKQQLLAEMDNNPAYWQKYYQGDKQQVAVDCQFSFSDRIRYYWPTPAVSAALEQLIDNLDRHPPPLTLLSQYLPNQYTAIMAEELAFNCKAIILHKISEVLEQYANACFPSHAA